MTHTSTEQGCADFEAWWQSDGQFCRAGGGDYEKTFAYHAWRKAAPEFRCLDCEDTGVNTRTGYDCSYCFGDFQAAPMAPVNKKDNEMTHTSIELLMKLADDYAEACFDQGLHQRTTDDKPEAARAKLEKELRRLHARAYELEKEAARYRFLRDTCWSSDKELATVISLQMNKVWDEKIDEALARNKKE